MARSPSVPATPVRTPRPVRGRARSRPANKRLRVSSKSKSKRRTSVRRRANSRVRHSQNTTKGVVVPSIRTVYVDGKTFGKLYSKGVGPIARVEINKKTSTIDCTDYYSNVGEYYMNLPKEWFNELFNTGQDSSQANARGWFQIGEVISPFLLGSTASYGQAGIFEPSSSYARTTDVLTGAINPSTFSHFACQKDEVLTAKKLVYHYRMMCASKIGCVVRIDFYTCAQSTDVGLKERCLRLYNNQDFCINSIDNPFLTSTDYDRDRWLDIDKIPGLSHFWKKDKESSVKIELEPYEEFILKYAQKDVNWDALAHREEFLTFETIDGVVTPKTEKRLPLYVKGFTRVMRVHVLGRYGESSFVGLDQNNIEPAATSLGFETRIELIGFRANPMMKNRKQYVAPSSDMLKAWTLDTEIPILPGNDVTRQQLSMETDT